MMFLVSALIVGRRHFVFLRKIDPDLDHVHDPAGAREIVLVIFIVQDALAGGHPLHFVRVDNAAVAGAVMVSDRALISDGHGLEPAVRMRSDAATVRRRAVSIRPVVIQQEKRTHPLHKVGRRRKIVVHLKPVSDPMFGRSHKYFFDCSFHKCRVCFGRE